MLPEKTSHCMSCSLPDCVLRLTLKATSHGSKSSAKMQAYIRGGCSEAALSCCKRQCIQKTAELVNATVVANPADCRGTLHVK